MARSENQRPLERLDTEAAANEPMNGNTSTPEGINWGDLIGRAIETAPRFFNPPASTTPTTNPTTVTQLPEGNASSAMSWWKSPAVIVGAVVGLVIILLIARK